MSEYPKFKLPDNPTLVVEQTDKALAKKLDVNFRYAYFKKICLLYTSPSPRDLSTSRMPSSA